jgi:glutamine synthetase
VWISHFYINIFGEIMKQTYALSNPLSILLDKSREEFTREDMIRVIEEKQIERITFHYTGLDGKFKELKLPVTNQYQAERILADGERVDGSSLFKGLVSSALSDLYVVPVYKTAFLNPFDNKSLDFICRYLDSNGKLAPISLDNVLHKANMKFEKSTGMELWAMGELEFFLLTKSDSSHFSTSSQRGYHAASPFIKSGEILNEMLTQISQITGAVKYAHSEVGFVKSVRSDHDELKGKTGEQVEIEFLPTPIEDAADNLQLARWLVRNIAHNHGQVATFSPKIEEGVAGNGYHIHMQLMKNGVNIMNDENGKLSESAKKVIGGLCKYATTLTAFGNTVSSAYLRLVPNQEAPTKVCWSDLNRSAMIRVPLGWSNKTNLAKSLNPQQKSEFNENIGRQTVELRSPDGSAITHLLLAGIAMAAEWGLTNNESLELAEELYVVGNIFKEKKILKKLPSLPKSCVESSKWLQKHRDLYERDGVFPESIINYVVQLLKNEQDENINQRLVDLPADDRLHQTRKIMHRNIHRH